MVLPKTFQDARRCHGKGSAKTSQSISEPTRGSPTGPCKGMETVGSLARPHKATGKGELGLQNTRKEWVKEKSACRDGAAVEAPPCGGEGGALRPTPINQASGH